MESEKQRTPSWTDRIQWLSLHERSVECLSYDSHPEITLSDHQPVSALLKVQVCLCIQKKADPSFKISKLSKVMTVVTSKRQQVQEEIMAELDAFDNSQLPDVKLLPGPAVQFEMIEYEKAEVREVEVKNVGKVSFYVDSS